MHRASGTRLHKLTAEHHENLRASNSKYSFAISPRDPREYCINIPLSEHQRAQGMPGAHCARSLACKIK
jgi:hypothetical protein